MIPFNKVKKKLGLDDYISFGKYRGCTVLELIKDAPGYVSWLMQNTDLKFYESVHEQLKIAKPKHVPRGPCGPWTSHGTRLVDYDHDTCGEYSDYFADVPF